MNLNKTCIRIKIGDRNAFDDLISDHRVVAVLKSAVYRIIRKNPEYDAEYLYTTLKNEVWLSIYNSYVGATDLDKGDNLVLRFIKSIAYNKLLNFIRKEKGLTWSSEGYSKRADSIALDDDLDIPDDSDTEELAEKGELSDIISRSINEAVLTDKITYNDAQILILKFKNDLEHSEIRNILIRQLDMKCSVSWIAQRVHESIKALKPILIKNNIGAYV